MIPGPQPSFFLLTYIKYFYRNIIFSVFFAKDNVKESFTLTIYSLFRCALLLSENKNIINKITGEKWHHEANKYSVSFPCVVIPA